MEWREVQAKRWTGDDTSRFWEKVDRSGDCWLWTGAKCPDGYGLAWYGKRLRGVHRIAFEMVNGPIPEGKQLDHLCRNRACVKPAHLEIVTQRVNTLRGTSFAASKARQTHCKHGHEFTPANTRLRGNRRVCRECNKLQKRIKRQADSL